ncbi:dTMP kinase [Candidatus Acetothermia bacterium]|nr:dTMP kinase [Candidatus Acetothermia bacterium]MBI3461279.1 dTMP kinase [Candidatus Acetothermia bacterium]MBI3660571.1 dTMP kinase [Candidatus Acetothermia bacterium]
MSRGLFVALEGIDGSGKSTLMRRVKQNLVQCGHDVVTVEEPGGTPAGDKIRHTLLDKTLQLEPVAELFLFEASRHQLVQTVIRPALESKKIVLADRFTMSSVAYQGYGRGLSLELIETLNELATGGLKPDLTVLLDLPVELALQRKRGQRDRMEIAGLEFLQRVRSAYWEQIAQLNEDGLHLDATQSVEQLTNMMMEKIREKGEQYGILLRPR